jgi:hypothetical protein
MELSHTLNEVARLREEWLRTDKHRAAGGRMALSGFHFQLASTLLDRVASWCELPRDQRATIAVFDEMISDALKASANEIVITQSKLTGSATKLRTALDELWNVDAAARRLEPALAVDIRYQVRVSRLTAADTTVGRWVPVGMEEDTAGIVRFKQRLTICAVADPERELPVLLANRLGDRDPLDTVERWIGRLVHAAARGEGLSAAAEEIWRDLWRLDQADKVADRIILWSDQDVPPADVTSGDYLSGERPLLRHLSGGYFANRPEVYAPLADGVADWITSSPAQKDRSARLPVFWIGGRSGSGKSVALLQILAILYQRGYGPILWIGDKVGNLRQAVEAARAFARSGVQTLIALDDPYSPSAHNNAQEVWREALDSLEPLRQHGEVSEIPLIVCCGPSEQGERFQEDFRDDVQVTTDTVPQESHGDLTGLREWFFTRTGHRPPDLGSGNVLLVQLFFEWRVQVRLPEFARRLKLRILDDEPTGHLLDFIATLLSANRLYVGLPPGAVDAELSSREQGMMQRLRDENHLVETERSGRREIWLAHPHLANAVYESWYPVSHNGLVRADHLRHAIYTTFRYGTTPQERTAVLWAIARALLVIDRDTSDVVGRIDQESLPGVLTRAYADLCVEAGDAVPIWLLPVWIALQARSPVVRLEPNPAEIALRQLVSANRTQTGFRLTCHLLLQHANTLPKPTQEKIIEAVVLVLRANPDWYEWEPVARDALLRTGDHRLVALVADWAVKHREDARTPRLLLAALTRLPRNRTLSAAAVPLLPGAAGSPAWGDLAMLLWDQSDQERPPLEVVTWAGRNRKEFGCCFLLGRMLRISDSLWPVWGFEWARLWHLEKSASYVLEPLFLVDPANRQILAWCRNWLTVGHPAGGYLIVSLLTHAGRDRTVVALALEWLAAVPPEHGSWTFRWRTLWDCGEERDELRRLGREWLGKAPSEHGSWLFLWEALWQAGAEHDELRRLGREWLVKAPPEHKSWTYLWKTLWDSGDEHGELRRLGLEWLGKAPPEHGSWTYLWETLWDFGEEHDELRRLGREWLLNAPSEHGSWWFLWEALWQAGAEHDELRRLGREWLVKAPPEHKSWQYLWKTLWESGAEHGELRRLGLEWLGKAPAEHGSWKFVWEALWQAGTEHDELQRLGLEWLRKAPPEHGSWKFVWEVLWPTGADHEELQCLGLQWLGTAPLEHGSWTYLWKTLWNSDEEHDELRGLGLQWLKAAPMEHGWWSFMWEALWPCDVEHEELRRLGVEWLRAVPPEHASWHFVWNALLKVDVEHDELLRLGLEWLRGAPPEHGSWHFMWNALWKAGVEHDELLRRGLEWLRGAPPEHGSWPFMWNALWKAGVEHDELLRLGLEWLRGASPEHGSWKFVWDALWKAGADRDELRRLGLEWLKKSPADHAMWKPFWKTLWKSPVDRDELRRVGLEWLKKSPAEHGTWQLLWRTLWASGEEHEELGRLGREWLGRAPAEHGSWSYLWRTLWDSGEEHEELGRLGREWLGRARPEHGSWVFVWNPLWEAGGERDELRRLGLAWLTSVPPEHNSWVFLWNPLWQSGEEQDELRRLGVAWLGQAPSAHGSWTFLWQALWQAAEERDKLRRLGLAWLTNAPLEHGSWAFVWNHLWHDGEKHDELRRLGLAWLANVPAEHGSWTLVWEPLWQDGEKHDELRRLGLAWLANAPAEHGSWTSVWEPLWQDGEHQDELRLLEIEWLAKMP